jgi:hypothetical protein
VKVKTLKSFLFRGCRCDQSPCLAVDNGPGTKPKVITKKRQYSQTDEKDPQKKGLIC